MNKPRLFVSALISLTLALAVSASQLTEYGPIKDGDNLWAIAKLLRPDDSISVAHMTRLLFKYNPQAFINKDLNRLKKGVMIRVPDQLIYNTYTSDKQLHSVETTEPDTAATIRKQSQSKRSTGQQPSAHKLPKDNQKPPSDMANLADLKKEIDRLRRENATKRNEIKSLRSELSALREASFTTEKQVIASASTSTPESELAKQASTQDAAIKPVIAEPSVETQQKQNAEPLSKQTDTDNNLLILIGLGVGVSVMVVIVGIMWRQGTIATKLLEQEHFGQITNKQVYRTRMPTALENQIETKPEESTAILLSAADIQLNNGNPHQAEALLQQALAKDPSRDDVKLKLLQIYYMQKDQLNSEKYGADSTDAQNLINASPEELRKVDQTTENIDDQRTSNLIEIENSHATFMGALQRAEASLDADRIDDEHTDKVETKLELAQACVDMGDLDRAQSILTEVMQEGTQTQREQAGALIMQYKKRLLNIG